jgi:hypothetical protein
MIIMINPGGFMKFKVRNLRFKLIMFFSLFTIHFSLFTISYAAHPLITDDTGTQGKGKFQIELNSEYAHEDEDGAEADTTEIAAILSYGVTDTMDIVLGLPYQYLRVKEDGIATTEDGVSDMSIELKWRFYEKEELSFALKPGLSLPTGDDEKGLGTGRVTYSMFFITTKEIEPWAFHANLGYIRNENKVDERKNLWHASLASVVVVVKDLRFVTNIGVESNPDKKSNTHPAFLLGGVIYSITENFDIDAGIKAGLNKPETDLTFLAGMAVRF